MLEMRSKLLQWITNRENLLSLAMIGIAALIYYEVHGLRPDNRMLPRVVAILTAVCGVAHALHGAKTGGSKAAARGPFDRVQLAIVTGILLAIAVMRVVGFYSSLFLLSLFCSLFLFRPFSWKSVFRAFGYSLVLTVVLYAVFRVALGMFTPRGLFM